MSSNQNEKVSSWNGNSDDGLLLKMLVERHLIENMKPSEIKAKYPQFRKYTPNCFCSAMKSVRHSYHNKQAKKIKLNDSNATTGIVDKFDANLIDRDDMNRKTPATNVKSVVLQMQPKEESASIAFHGSTTISLPYFLAERIDKDNRKRVSIRVHLLSGMTKTDIITRVSTDQKFLVLSTKMSEDFSDPKKAFSCFLPSDSEALHVLHPKCISRMMTISSLFGKHSKTEFEYVQRIELPKPCLREFATSYDDNSVFLHVELIVDQGEMYP